MTILQAVAAGLENTEKRKEPKKKADRYFLDGKVADRELKVCNLCRIVWQRHVFNGKQLSSIMMKCQDTVKKSVSALAVVNNYINFEYINYKCIWTYWICYC